MGLTCLFVTTLADTGALSQHAQEYTWTTATDAQREELLEFESAFMDTLFACNLGCPTGDHTREAIQRLSASHPNRKKYKVFAKG